ncbi:hypothetical protein DWX41_10925 [Hungatella hathewayi]|uniref:Uncharacterized protein n=1 Tax=Hungatella hathewayi TaxID=154046 RepID=A0A3E2WW91_9FIRM|nr:hypothetical protein [Faecalicatena contorta]RGC32122.1 hypothetical protein DWX41_10925 [Hungatella hathewayi]
MKRAGEDKAGGRPQKRALPQCAYTFKIFPPSVHDIPFTISPAGRIICSYKCSVRHQTPAGTRGNSESYEERIRRIL